MTQRHNQAVLRPSARCRCDARHTEQERALPGASRLLLVLLAKQMGAPPTTPRGSLIHPYLDVPRSLTPAESPAQSPKPTPTVAFPFKDTVGLCISVSYGPPSLHLRCGLPVALSTLRRTRYLAQRRTRLLLVGWTLTAKELPLLDQ
jgi:hypothetical protein